MFNHLSQRYRICQSDQGLVYKLKAVEDYSGNLTTCGGDLITQNIANVDPKLFVAQIHPLSSSSSIL
ncbi:hypothetical protein L1987_66041 [Smallanthus sonchifolius]|uniref:Uncharacterized protein n=1 Tax=Smallanthus sonchifolius TaxID=185202 RepID=A0ACB9BW07_9ASTR|nr:hypothetical protein L1987_66041 [Smallanthus sonchifolius]